MRGSSTLARTRSVMALGIEVTEQPARVLPADGLLAVARGVTDLGGEVWIRVTGLSMNPLLREGDSVLLSPLTQPPRRGDVLLIDMHGAPLLHRVRRFEGASVVTRGDACQRDDPAAAEASCIGRAIAARRGGSVLVLVPTLRFGVRPLVRYAAWWLRVRIPFPSFGRAAQRFSSAIVRAFT